MTRGHKSRMGHTMINVRKTRRAAAAAHPFADRSGAGGPGAEERDGGWGDRGVARGRRPAGARWRRGRAQLERGRGRGELERGRGAHVMHHVHPDVPARQLQPVQQLQHPGHGAEVSGAVSGERSEPGAAAIGRRRERALWLPCAWRRGRAARRVAVCMWGLWPWCVVGGRVRAVAWAGGGDGVVRVAEAVCRGMASWWGRERSDARKRVVAPRAAMPGLCMGLRPVGHVVA
mmetsp:Transcript_23753/g.69728  ORF Transcript_23753/g.69728 Transcript_23753/m.69728 type:complete len:232 (+) Transcript_23753:534-1229(+)